MFEKKKLKRLTTNIVNNSLKLCIIKILRGIFVRLLDSLYL